MKIVIFPFEITSHINKDTILKVIIHQLKKVEFSDKNASCLLVNFPGMIESIFDFLHLLAVSESLRKSFIVTSHRALMPLSSKCKLFCQFVVCLFQTWDILLRTEHQLKQQVEKKHFQEAVNRGLTMLVSRDLPS